MCFIVTTDSLPFLTRLWFAWVCLVRVLFDGSFAAQVFRIHAPPAAPPAEREQQILPERPRSSRPDDDEVEASKPRDLSPALQLLALFQREGRLVDFLEQDIASFSDVDVGAAARVVHEGCRKALRSHAKVVPVRSEEENSEVQLETGFRPSDIKLSGDVRGAAPYRGTLRHRGWRVTELELPTPVEDHDPKVLAPAEVEL